MKNRLSKHVWSLLYFGLIFPLGTVTAQAIEPDDPEIVLPPLLLEVEDVSEESVKAIVPQGEEQLLPEISVPLPDVDDLTFGGPEYAQIPFPDQPPVIIETADTAQSGPTVFSEGMLGGGTMSHITGDISLYQIGTQPSFSLRFSHENLDGYGFRKPGSGFKRREDTIEGTLSVETDMIRSDTEAYYTDAENGLQQNSDYDAVTHRFYSLTSEFLFIAPKIVKLYADAGIYGVNMILSSATPVNQAELNFHPRLGIGFAFPAVEFGIRGNYAFRSYFDDNDVIHSAGAEAYVDAELPLAIDLSASGGFLWNTETDFAFPFTVSLRGMVKDFFIYGISGGYRVEPALFTHVWRDYPFFGYSAPLVNTESWFADGDVEFRFLRWLSIKAGVEFTAVTAGEITPAATPDATTGLYDTSGSTGYHLYLSSGVSYDPGKIFSGSLRWIGQVLPDADPLAPEHLIDLSLGLRSPNDRVGGQIDARFPFDPGFIVPTVTATGFLKITEGITVEVEANDVFAPAIQDGRIDWGVYEGPGFHFTAKLRVSL